MLLVALGMIEGAVASDNFIRGYQFAGATGLYTGVDLEDLVTEARYADTAVDPNNTNRLFDTTFFTNVTIGGISNLLTIKDGSIDNAALGTNAVTTDKILDGTILPADLSFTFTVVGYMEGMYPTYVNTNTVSFTNGAGYCNGDYFNLRTNLSYTLTGLTTNSDFHNIYLDYSASTLPGVITLYDTTNDPVYVAAQVGYYCTTSTTDRLMASLLSTNGVTTLEAFVCDDGGYVLTNQMIVEETLTGSPYWTNTTISVPGIIPPTASHILVRTLAADSSVANTLAGAARKELRDLMPDPFDRNQFAYDFMHQSYGWLIATDWMPLGPSRDIYIFGDSVDDDWEVGIYGWRIKR